MRLLREAEVFLVGFIEVETFGDVFEVARAVVAATTTVGSVTDGVVLDGVRGIDSDGVRIAHYNVCPSSVIGEVEVVTVEAEGDWVPWVEGFD